ncbi:MAG: TonB-dependent receptor [Thermoflavifilum aggregans]|nr:TonB-dependent receptor [Thermoflavifilum aggregans]
MKLATFFLFIGCLQVSATAYSQKTSINLSLRDVSLEKAFTAIKEQSDYLFLYNNEKLNHVADKISLKVKDATIQQVMDACLKGLPLSYKIIDKTVIIIPGTAPMATTGTQQPIEISGRVTDSVGTPLIGVSVQVKGTGKGTITDANGHFTLEVPNKNAILVFSYIGYRPKEVAVNGQSYIQVVLEGNISQLSQLVVVGYGVEKKENLTSAISQIDDKYITSRPTSNVVASLQGLLPGLNIQSNNGDPGARPDINVRGFNSINGGSPLVLIDGVEGDITRVNPADIKSVTVLKDAASAAIYGARGAFGVILITTKMGQAGKMTLNYTNNIGWTTPTVRTDFISDPYVYGKTVDAALYGYNGTTYTGYNDLDWATIKMVADGEISPFIEAQPGGKYKFFYKTNWYNYLFRKWQPFQNHNISLSGGSDKMQGYLSGRFYKTTGIQNIQDADLLQYQLLAKVNYKVTNWLQLSDKVHFSTKNQIEYGGYKNGYGGIWSNTTWYYLFAWQPTSINGIPFDYMGVGAQAPLEAGNNWKRYYSEQFINTFSGELTPMKGLVFNFNYTNTIVHVANTLRDNKFQYLTGDKLELQTVGLSKDLEDRDRNYTDVLNIYGTYTKDIATNHHFKLMLGYNQESYKSDNVRVSQGDLLIDNLTSLSLGTNPLLATGSADVWSIQGYFGRLNYDYKHKYLLEVNARYDGSSRFPRSSRWGIFPSISGGWYVSRENFWKPLEQVVSSFKLRASYGKLGNQNVPLYTFSEVMGVGQTSWMNNDAKLSYVAAPAPLPSVVTWERVGVIDYGADFGFLQNKLTASFDWYKKDITGMYVPGSPLPAVFGAPEPKENIASLQDIGFELSLGYHDQFNVNGSPLHVSAVINLYNFKGVITKYPNPNGLMSTYWKGQKLGEIWGYHIDGQFQSDEEAKKYESQFENPSVDLGQVYNYVINVVTNTQWKGLRAGDIKYVDTNGDGKIGPGNNTLSDHGDLQPIGNAMPQFPFGFTIGADWKGIDISVAGAGVAHQDWYPTGFIYWGSYARPYSSFIRKDLVAKAWSPDNPKGIYPQIYRGYTALGLNNHRMLGEMNDYYLTNVGYLRVKNLTIGYTFPQSLTQRAKIQELRIYFSGENIFTWRFGNLTKYIDPEQAGSGINYNDPGSATDEADLQDWPIGKTYSLGINIVL